MDGLSSIRLLADFWILIISVIAFILQFYCLSYLMKNRNSDFFYSGHVFVWYEGSTRKLILAILGFAVGMVVFMTGFALLFKG